jgi:ribosomal protein S7
MNDEDEDRQRITTAIRRQRERDEVRTAIAQSHATESIGRKLGDDLIDASREVVAAWHERSNSEHRMAKAVKQLEDLVGKP